MDGWTAVAFKIGKTVSAENIGGAATGDFPNYAGEIAAFMQVQNSILL